MRCSREKSLIFILSATLMCAVLAMSNCGGDEAGPDGPNGIVGPGPDTIPPARVVDLRLRVPSIHSLAVVWTAPGDDGTKGTATEYDIRWSDAPITDDNWDQATPLDPALTPVPKPGGQIETIVCTGLSAGTTYHYALKAADEIPNWSPLSNSDHGTTLGEVDPPADVTDLAAVALDLTSFELTWTAPGDDGAEGQAAEYDIRYSTTPVDDETDWDAATRLNGVPAPGPSGQAEHFTVTGLGNADGYFFVLRTADELGNWSGLSNVAVGMKFGNTFWAFPKHVALGENVYIVFETSTSDTLSVTTNGVYVPRVCGVGVIEELVRDVFADGIHVIAFDFFNRSEGEYYRADYYWLALCRGGESLEMESIEFTR